ncbi:MAG: glycosyltransferase family 2 protein [Flavobacteriaceae bacterium]|nr:glycosyltransferase family 2 protein [Flavobacteriaceae bacterium]
MISVLIPLYNYDIQLLINNLKKQFKTIKSDWEIIISDDASESKFRVQNLAYIEKINKPNIILFQQKINIGNGPNRNFLIEKANFDWLLFLDADVLPVNNNFLSVYIHKMKATEQDIIAGNIIYDNNNPLPHLLRWKYGKKKEQVSFLKRKKKPVLNVRGANFAIKKLVAQKLNFPILQAKYGLVDTRFFLQFKFSQIYVIENPVYHLGIEENNIYLQKTKQAVTNALFLMKNDYELSTMITLISKYKKIRVFNKALSFLYTLLHKPLETNLLSDTPSVTMFQLYKILYISHLDTSKNI